MAAIPVSLVIGSPVAGWILGHNWFAIEGWRWLFLLEGVPAILLGVVAFFFLTEQPAQARWLSAEQRQWDCENAGTRKAAESTIDNDRSGIPFSYCASARHRSLSSILRWI